MGNEYLPGIFHTIHDETCRGYGVVEVKGAQIALNGTGLALGKSGVIAAVIKHKNVIVKALPQV